MNLPDSPAPLPGGSLPDIRPDWVVCIKHSHAEKKGLAWCGRTVSGFEFGFESIDHAAYNALAGNRLVTCEQCAKAVVEAIGSNK